MRTSRIKNTRRGWRQESHKFFAYLTMRSSTLHASHLLFFFFIFLHFTVVLVLSKTWNDLFAVRVFFFIFFSFYSPIPFHQFNPLIDKQRRFEKSIKYYRKAELHFRRRPRCLPPSLSFLWKLQNRSSSVVDSTRTIQRWNMLGMCEKLLFLLLTDSNLRPVFVAVVVEVA